MVGSPGAPSDSFSTQHRAGTEDVLLLPVPLYLCFIPRDNLKAKEFSKAFKTGSPGGLTKKKDDLKTPQCHMEWCLLLFHSTENKGVLYNWQFPTRTLEILQTHLGAAPAPGDPASERGLK